MQLMPSSPQGRLELRGRGFGSCSLLDAEVRPGAMTGVHF